MHDRNLDKWLKKENQLEQIFTFNAYLDGANFVYQVAEIAEEENHHPVIVLNYNSVHISTTTHDAGNKITAKDINLATKITKLFEDRFE